MDYGKIISESFHIAWRHKLLWVFGLFAGGGLSGFDSLNVISDHDDFREMGKLGDAFGNLGWSLPEPTWAMIVPLLTALAVFALVMLVMHFVSVSALIDAVNRIKRGSGAFLMGQSFSAGLDFFFRILGLGLIYFVAGLLIVVVGVGLLVAAFRVHVALGLLSLLPTIPIAFVIIWVMTNTIGLAQRALVVRNTRIADAIEESWTLFRRHLKENLLIFLIYIGLSIGIGLAAMIIWLICGIPVAFLALAAGVGLVPTLLLAILLGLPISLVVGGFTGTALFNMYTLFYFELVEPSAKVAPGLAPSTV